MKKYARPTRKQSIAAGRTANPRNTRKTAREMGKSKKALRKAKASIKSSVKHLSHGAKGKIVAKDEA